jgi:hypothetical protein
MIEDVVALVMTSFATVFVWKVVREVGLGPMFDAVKGAVRWLSRGLGAAARRAVEGPPERKAPWAIEYPRGIEALIADLDGDPRELVDAVRRWVEGGEDPSSQQARVCRACGKPLPQGRARCPECAPCKDCERPGHDGPCPPPRRDPMRPESMWPTAAAPPALSGASSLTPLLVSVDPAGSKPVEDLTPTEEEFRLLGGPYAGEAVRLVYLVGPPEVIALPDGVQYEQVTDPDSGAFLGGYAIRGGDVPCSYCHQPPHRADGTHTYDPEDPCLP